MNPRTRKITAAAAGALLGIPAATAAFPLLGLAAGAALTAGIFVGGVTGFLMMVPAAPQERRPVPRTSYPAVGAALASLTATCDGIERSEISAALRNASETLFDLMEEDLADRADAGFVVMNMQSLVHIGEAWRHIEKISGTSSSDLLALRTIETVKGIAENARGRLAAVLARANKSLEFELGLSERKTAEDRKSSVS
jgi:hypothetical protein